MTSILGTWYRLFLVLNAFITNGSGRKMYSKQPYLGLVSWICSGDSLISIVRMVIEDEAKDRQYAIS
jgi:hypothetical protein